MSTLHLRPALALAGAAMLMVSGCSSGYAALGTRTAAVSVNGNDIGERPAIRCEQNGWNWYIETLKESPGFVVQMQTGESVIARGVQIENLGGFTGSFWDGTVGSADAQVSDGTMEVSGTAEGYYRQDPSEDATARFVIRADC